VPDQLMVWDGTDAPCGTATLMSIGCLSLEQNKNHSLVLSSILQAELGIPDKRFVYFVLVLYKHFIIVVFIDCISLSLIKNLKTSVLLEQPFIPFWESNR